MKRNKQYIKSIILLLLSISLCTTKAQEWGQINRLNEQGQKEGFWIERFDEFQIESYYKKGKASGVYKEYHNDYLFCFGEYKEEKMTGIWYYLYDDRRITMLCKDCSENNKYTDTNDGDKIIFMPDTKGYCIGYYPDGKIREEGLLLWWQENGGPLVEFIEYGEWKYYDKDENKITFKEYRKLKYRDINEWTFSTNSFNRNGQKEGFWEEGNACMYYRNGLRNGIYTEFTETPPSSLPINGAEGEKSRITQKLAVFGEYTHGEMSGTWYFFNPIGQLTKTYKHFSRETNLINKPMSKDNFRQTHRCYCTEFYPDATVKEEGWIIWTDDPRSEFARKKGEWKTYSPEGKLIKTEFFK